MGLLRLPLGTRGLSQKLNLVSTGLRNKFKRVEHNANLHPNILWVNLFIYMGSAALMSTMTVVKTRTYTSKSVYIEPFVSHEEQILSYRGQI